MFVIFNICIIIFKRKLGHILQNQHYRSTQEIWPKGQCSCAFQEAARRERHRWHKKFCPRAKVLLPSKSFVLSVVLLTGHFIRLTANNKLHGYFLLHSNFLWHSYRERKGKLHTFHKLTFLIFLNFDITWSLLHCGMLIILAYNKEHNYWILIEEPWIRVSKLEGKFSRWPVVVGKVGGHLPLAVVSGGYLFNFGRDGGLRTFVLQLKNTTAKFGGSGGGSSGRRTFVQWIWRTFVLKLNNTTATSGGSGCWFGGHLGV